jgi:hypothetical protein
MLAHHGRRIRQQFSVMCYQVKARYGSSASAGSVVS